MKIVTSIGFKELAKYTTMQINTFFPDSSDISEDKIIEVQNFVIPKLEYCFSHINNKYFRNKGDVVFDHLNSDHYSMFLYMMSFAANSNFNDPNLASKIYLLNKLLHGIDAFYEVELPSIFLFIHPVGTVLGRAKYSDYFVVYQGCGVGSNNKASPSIGRFVTLHPNSHILGNSVVKDNCDVATGALILDTNVEENSIFIGRPGNERILPKKNMSSLWSTYKNYKNNK